MCGVASEGEASMPDSHSEKFLEAKRAALPAKWDSNGSKQAAAAALPPWAGAAQPRFCGSQKMQHNYSAFLFPTA